jgi:Lrp/AsnC family leucine-responsive transcriptional regulator
MIDEIDRQILSILQQNARTSNAEIARQVEMAPSAVLERIRRLEARGVIQGYEVRINPEALGLDILAFVFVRTTSRARTAS